MALYLAKTRIENSRQREVASGFAVGQEGLALVFTADNGVGKVRPSAGGVNTERFAGFAMSHTMVPTSATFFGEVKAVGTTLTLPQTPIAGQLYLLDGAQVLTAGAPGNANEYSISGNVVTLHSGQADKSITVALRYALTVEQAILLHGEGMAGDLASSDIYDRTGTVTAGIIATDQYTINTPFTAGGPAYLGANGQVTATAGSNTIIPNCSVQEVPSAANGGWLVLDLI